MKIKSAGMHKAHKGAPLNITLFQRHNTILCGEQALSHPRVIKLWYRMWCSQNTCICNKVLIYTFIKIKFIKILTFILCKYIKILNVLFDKCTLIKWLLINLETA